MEGRPCSPSAITFLAAGIQRYGRDILKIHDFKLFDKTCKYFSTFQDSLDSKHKCLLAEGIGHNGKHKDEVIEQDEVI